VSGASAAFTGERLHAGDPLFAVDLARHQAAYELARARLPAGRVLDLGCGSGYGAASLARAHRRVVALDRARPDPAQRAAPHFVRADVAALPFAAGSFELVLSFQVIEHLADPAPYLSGIARALAPGGLLLLTTPNLLESDGVNPYHVHEYRAEELAALLRRHFAQVELHGIGASDAVRAYLGARSRRIRAIVRLDPLRLRERLPRPLVEWLFARFALLVRRRTREGEGVPAVSWHDFPPGPADPRCLDLLAACRQPL
jgi:SAM-dependent methyltransferase